MRSKDSLFGALLSSAALIMAISACAEAGSIMIGVEGISAPELHQRLQEEPATLVIDVRETVIFESGHIPGANSIQIEELDGYLTRAPLSRSRPVVTVCNYGKKSLTAAAVVSAYGFSDVHSLQKGMEGWIEKDLPLELGPGPRPPSEIFQPPEHYISLPSQVGMVINGFVIKPAHMVITLFLIIALWREEARDLVFIRRAMIAFLFGEAMCAANYVFAQDESFVLELLHDSGMIGVGILLPWGFFLMADDRVLRLSRPDKPCAIQRFCGKCWKRDDVRCGLQQIFRLACIALAVLALLPLTAPLRPFNIIWPVFGVDLSCPLGMDIMLLEFRVFPIIAFVSMSLAALRLWGKEASIEKAIPPFFIGLGFLCFSLTRFLLFQGLRDSPGWAFVWEEVTELITVIGVGVVLWVFRRQLGLIHWPWQRANKEVEPVARQSTGS